ncbi:MAG: PEGA domain-containing protein [Candidatus Zixiibacteriota bacterium]|nr:MAG: PEGA domain-containing protein [candidate division Zixibacteria bacterium]
MLALTPKLYGSCTTVSVLVCRQLCAVLLLVALANAETVRLCSDPDSATVLINDEPYENTTPVTLTLTPGQYRLEVLRDEYVPLDYNLQVQPGDSLSLTFVLSMMPPAPLPPESLGLSFAKETPLLNEKLADKTKDRWTNAAEFFTVFPTAQGLAGRLFFGNDRKREANVLLFSGLTLSLGSFVIGHVLAHKKLTAIRRANDSLAVLNQQAKRHNEAVKRQLRAINKERESQWQQRNRQRGRVSMRRLSGPSH